MAERNNRDGQAARQANGSSFERDFRNIVWSWIEKDGLEKSFDLVRKIEYPYHFPNAAEPYLLKPDLTIIHAATGSPVIHGGAKRSCRERYTQDALESFYLKEKHPQSIYIFGFDRENEGKTDYLSKYDFISKQFVPFFFAAVFCTRISNSMGITKDVVLRHLRGFQSGTQLDMLAT